MCEQVLVELEGGMCQSTHNNSLMVTVKVYNEINENNHVSFNQYAENSLS